MNNNFQTNKVLHQKNNDNVFFTKKKIITFSILFVIFLALIILVSKFFFDINFNVIAKLFSNSYNQNNLFFLWLFLLLIFPVYHVWFRIFLYKYKLKQHNIYVSWYNWLFFCLISIFIDNITPFAIGSQPYIIYWLKKQGLKLQDATAIVASMTFLNPCMQIIITWPSFFYLCSLYGQNCSDQGWNGCFWSVFVGLTIDLIGTIFWIVISYSKKAHYFINLIINKIKKLFKFKYIEKEEIKEEFIKNSSFKKKMIKEVKDWKYLLMITIGCLLWNVIYYCSIIFAFNLIDPFFDFNSGDLFNYVNVATTANNFIPIPGAEGTLQAVLCIFIQRSANNTISDPTILKEVTNNSVFIWRSFTFYIPTIIGTIWFIMLILKEIYKIILSKKRYKLNKYERSFSIIIPYYNCNQYILKAIESINDMNYDKRLIQVLIINDGSTEKDNSNLKFIKKNYSFVEIHNKKNAQWGSVLNYVKKNKLIKNEYVSVLDADDYLDKNVYKYINQIPNDYDLFALQFRKFNGKKVKRIVSPYWYLYKKVLTNKQQMNTPFCLPLNYFVKTKIFYKIRDLVEKIPYQDSDYLSQLIKLSKNMRYLRRVGGYYFYNRPNNSISQKWDEKRYSAELTACLNCIKNNAQEIVSLRMNLKHFLEAIKEHNYKFKIKRKFSFKWFPWYIRWIYVIKHNIKFKKYFKLN